MHNRIRLGHSNLEVSRIGFGCWPIAGVSTLGTSTESSLATIRAALTAGINFFDTAYSYGYDGEADALLATVLHECTRDEIVVASKVGMYFDDHRNRVLDGRPETLAKHTGEILDRLGIDCLDLLYLHQPDPAVPVAESAGAIRRAIDAGQVKFTGVSNVTVDQLAEFQRECPIVAVQPPFNMLQQEGLTGLRARCLQDGIAIAAYWVLMKGLLAGKMARDHRLAPNDKRRSYPIFQGQAWNRSQDVLDVLRKLSAETGHTVSQLVIAWTLAQPGISVALCGAKRPEQIVETARAADIKLDDNTLAQIDAAVARFGANGDSD